MCGCRVAVPVESLVVRHVRSADCSRCSWLTSGVVFLIKQAPTALRCGVRPSSVAFVSLATSVLLCELLCYTVQCTGPVMFTVLSDRLGDL